MGKSCLCHRWKLTVFSVFAFAFAVLFSLTKIPADGSRLVFVKGLYDFSYKEKPMALIKSVPPQKIDFDALLETYTRQIKVGNGLFDFSHLEKPEGLIKPVTFQKINFDALLEDYTRKIQELQARGLWKEDVVKSCEQMHHIPKAPCVESSCPRPQPTTPEHNLRSVLSTMSELNHKQMSLMLGLFPEPPSGKRVMFVTGASNNHFGESQILLRNLHENVFPFISNYTFVYYDLGLLPWQREKANLPKTDILVWTDTSIRFWNKTIPQLLDDTERRGIVRYAGRSSVGQHTLNVTMNYMKANVCSLAPVSEGQAGFLLLHNERWIREAVLKPWVACAMSPKCMCPRNPNEVIKCNTGIHKYHKCHRFDQSAIGIILTKLFRHHTSSFYSPYSQYPFVRIDR